MHLYLNKKIKIPAKDGKSNVMNSIIINDCRDANAAGRQCARVSCLLGEPSTFIGVSSDIEAAGNLIDALDAFEGHKGVVLVNVAPRNGSAKKFKNGTPFGYFYVGKTLVISSIAGYTLSLVKKLKLVEEIKVFPPESVFNELGISEDADTQFRSFVLTPKIAQAQALGQDFSTEEMLIDEIPDIPNTVWWVDCFGNLKTSLLEKPVEPFFIGDTEVNFFPRLKYIPDNEAGLVVGSSGFGGKRFLEIMVNGGCAEEVFNLKSGDLL